VLADCEYCGENWENVQINEQLELDDSSPSGTSYERVFRKRTADHGGHLLVTEFAHDLDTSGLRPLLAVLRGLDSPAELRIQTMRPFPTYLTRLRAVVARDALDRDVVLVPTRLWEYDFVLNSHDIFVRSEERSQTASWLATVLLGIILAAIYIRFRRRRRSIR
jgi:hypothetical protein